MKKKVRLRELENWPPQPGGAFDSTYRSPSAEQAIIVEVMLCSGSGVTFVCEFDGKRFTYDYQAADSKQARSIARVLSENTGKSLYSVGAMDIEIE